MFKIKECRKLMKKCSKCGRIKLITKFGKEKKGKDGHRNDCKECKYKQSKQRHKIICLECNKEFTSQDKNQKFCSSKCMGKWRSKNFVGKNNPLTGRFRYELRGNNSPRWKEENHIYFHCEYCGKIKEENINSYNKKNHHFCCTKCRNKWDSENLRGSNNPHWNHDKSKEDRENSKHRNLTEGYNDFIIRVLKRDDYTCQITGKCGGKLEVHHLKSYNWYIEGRTDADNAVTLSKEIHKLFHKIYGNKHNTKEQFEEFKNRYNSGEFKEVI